MPDSTRNSIVLLESAERLAWSPVAKTMPQAITKITTVRTAVARLELTCATPTLAKIVVSAAKKAESNAYVPVQGEMSSGAGSPAQWARTASVRKVST